MAEVIMPKMGDGMSEGTLLSWKKQDGDQVNAGEVIAEIETDKSNVEIEAEDAGVLRTKTAVGQTVPVGTVIAVIGDSKNGNGNGTAAKTVQEVAPSSTSTNGAKPELVSGGEGLTVEIRSTEREDMARASQIMTAMLCGAQHRRLRRAAAEFLKHASDLGPGTGEQAEDRRVIGGALPGHQPKADVP